MLFHDGLFYIAFMVVTVLYTTSGSSVCSDTISDNAHVKKLVHMDFMSYDNSHNNNGDDKQEVDKDKEHHTVYCDCGRQAIFTLFECIVLVAILAGFIYMSCACCGHLKTIYLKKHESQLKKREKKEANLCARLRKRFRRMQRKVALALAEA